MQHRKIEATLARHEQSMEETKAAVNTMEAATKSISSQVQKIRMVLNVDCEEEDPPLTRLDAASRVRRAEPGCLFPPSILAEEGGSHAQQSDKTQTLADVEACRRPADPCNTLVEGSGRRRLEGGEDEAQRPGAGRGGTFRQPLQGKSPKSPNLPAGLGRSPLTVSTSPPLELLNGFERMGGRGLGSAHKPALRQTSQGQVGGGANEYGGHHDHTVTNADAIARLGSVVCNRTLTHRGPKLCVQRARFQSAGKCCVFAGLFKARARLRIAESGPVHVIAFSDNMSSGCFARAPLYFSSGCNQQVFEYVGQRSGLGG